jgi:hypothetical protein
MPKSLPFIRQVRAIDIDAHGRVCVFGTADTPTGGIVFAAGRLLADGSLDAMFGDAGTAVYEFEGKRAWMSAVMRSADGGAMLVGSVGNDVRSNIGLIHIDEDGRIDPEFGEQGFAIVAVNGTEFVQHGVRRGEGTFILVGSAIDIDGTTDGLIVELGSDGRLLESLGDAGVRLYPGPTGSRMFDGVSLTGADIVVHGSDYANTSTGVWTTEFVARMTGAALPARGHSQHERAVRPQAGR